MGLFDKLKRKMENKSDFIDYEHLNKLVETTNYIREEIVFQEIDISQCIISYMPTKKTSFIGFKEGYSDYLICKEKGMKHSDKVNTTTKNYLKYIKNNEGNLIQIECYIGGKMDYLYQVHWEKNVRYLLPFSSKGGFYPTYVFGTKYEGKRVIEEYMVMKKQIVYEKYDYKSENDVDYNYINYVSEGDYPVRERRKGKFSIEPFTYEENLSESWLD